MTGYGAATAVLPIGAERTLRYRVELKSVNHRFLDIRTRLGRELAPLEAEVTARLRSRLERGHVDVYVDPEPGATQSTVQIDRELASDAFASLQDLRRSIGLTDEVSLRDVLGINGVLSVSPVGLVLDDHRDAILIALDEALDDLCAMRTSEGSRLAADLRSRYARLLEIASEIEAHGPTVIAASEARLRERLNALLAEHTIDPARLAQEVAVLVDKSDVSEEITRVNSHLEQARVEMDTEPLGRGKKLEFMTQELLREFNTIGSKVGDTTITALVIEAKCELEKVREQVANLE